MTIVALSIARPAVLDDSGGFVPSVVAVAAPYAPRGPIIAGTSSTTNPLASTGLVSFVMNEPSLEFHDGTRLRASVTAGSNLWMEGVVTAYVTDTRLLTIALDLSSTVGGSYSAWSINITGAPGAPGPSGPAGTPGGPSGAVGPTGPQGPMGINGATGPSGPMGPSGTPGTPGGASGPTGPSGVAGAIGLTGPTGVSGPAGSSGGEVMVNGQLVVTAPANALLVAVKTLAGADPSAGSPVVFRIPNVTGTYDSISVTAALSLTIPSGATMGLGASSAFRLWVVAINNGGSIVLGIGRMSCEYNQHPIYPLGDSAAGRSTTLLNTASDLVGVMYSNPAVTAKAWRVLGYLEWAQGGLVVPGTWNTGAFRCAQLMSLGTRLPGSLVQSIMMQDSTSDTTIGTAVTTAYSFAGFLCNDPCNAVRITAQGIMWPDSVGQVGIARIFRDATAIGGMIEVNAAGVNVVFPGMMLATDFPNLVAPSPVTYSVRFWATGGTETLRWNPTALPLLLTIDEFMG